MGTSRNTLTRLFKTSKRLKAIRQGVKQTSPDVVLSFCDQTNISVLAATRGLGIPVVISERSDPSQQKLGTIWELARRAMYRRAARTIALTDSVKDYLIPMCPGGVIVIPSAVQQPPFISNRSIAAQSKRVIAIGRLAPEKGFDRLIQAFEIATKLSPEWTLMILGDGNERCRLEQLINELSLNDRIDLPGWVRPVWDELAKSTFFVLPSYYEGFPSALLEAMAIGVPSLAVDCESGPRAIIETGEKGKAANGMLVDNNTQALADGMIRMISDTTMREQLGHHGSTVVQRFGWDEMVHRYEQVLSSVAIGSDSLSNRSL